MEKIVKFTIIISMLMLILVVSYTNILSNVLERFSSIYAATKATASKKTSTSNAGGDMTYLLARLINGEARGEKYLGQVAVGAVVMNRVKSSKFPNTISGVIYQKGQFSCVKDGQFNKAISKNSTVYKAAREAINGADPTNGALFFYNSRTAKSKWIYSRPTVKVIGKHTFSK